MSESPFHLEASFHLEPVAWDDPRARAMREAMDLEVMERYRDVGLTEEALQVLVVDPADVITTQLVLRSDGTPIGHAALRWLDGECEVKRVIVAAGQRGRGIARALMDELERIAREQGALRLILQTGDRQPEAEALYAALGYTRIPIYEPYLSTMPFSRCFAKVLVATVSSTPRRVKTLMTDAARGYVVVAPDKFKGSLSGADVAAALSAGLRQGAPDVDVRLAPVADGGEGTVDAALFSGFAPQPVTVRGPLGGDVETVIAVRDDTAVVELALASGLQLVPTDRLEPLGATSFGTGELVRAALDAGCRTVILGIGGSANTDGGAGLVQALGARLLDADGRELGPGGGPLADLAYLDLTGLDPRISDTTFVIASDVDNPLLGPRGAAAVFGPQKGADPAQVELLDAALAHWAEVVSETVGKDYAAEPGAGAAGGVGFAAVALLSATSRPGIQLLLEMTGFVELLVDARLVITGEGSLDEQSLGGKAPVGVASAAAALGVPTVAVAGVTRLPADTLVQAGFAATYTLQDIEADLARCMSEAGPLLERIGRQIAADWLVDPTTTGTP